VAGRIGVALLLVALTGCGGVDSSPRAESDAAAANYQLRIRGDTASALMPSPEVARRFCESVKSGVSGDGLVGVRQVRLRAYGAAKPIVCRVPKPSLLD
jgi:hypothetical protein